jgi:hypothetical protein
MAPYGIDIIKVKVMGDYHLALTFEDGKTGRVDISQLVPFEGIFEPLKNKRYFNKVYVNPEIGTICWENGADLSPSFLYEKIQESD